MGCQTKISFVRPFVESFPLLSTKRGYWDLSLLNVLTECFHKIYENDHDMQNKISVQLPLYQNKVRSFEGYGDQANKEPFSWSRYNLKNKLFINHSVTT